MRSRAAAMEFIFGEGVMVPIFDFMTTIGCLIEVHGVDPDDRGGHHAKVEVIDHLLEIPGLGLGAPDLLVELLEPGLDLPPGRVVFDDLLDREGEVGSEKSNPAGAAKDPHPLPAGSGSLLSTILDRGREMR